MKLSDISIQRPVFAIVLSLLLIVLGVMAYSRLTLRELPAIDPPVVSVDVNYPGASAAVVETRVTQIIEDSLSGLEGVQTLESRSANGSSDITIEFNLTRDIEAAANDVRDAVSRVFDRLPEEADPPEIEKVESDAEVIIWLNMRSTTMDPLQLTDYAQRYIVDRLSALDGVAQVRVGGEQRYAMRIWLNRDQLAARGLTVADVEDALRNQNVELPAGRIESADRDFTLRVARGYEQASDFAQIPLGIGSRPPPVTTSPEGWRSRWVARWAGGGWWRLVGMVRLGRRHRRAWSVTSLRGVVRPQRTIKGKEEINEAWE